MIPQSPGAPNTIRLNIGGGGGGNVGGAPIAGPMSGLGGGYAQAPNTPRPNYATDTIRPTVYANSPVSPYVTSPVNEQFTPPISENNRQLRDLLQRQQMVAPNQQQSPMPGPQQSDMINANMNVNQQSGGGSNTFRQPLPPGMISRPQRVVGIQHQIRPHGMIENMNRVSFSRRIVACSIRIQFQFSETIHYIHSFSSSRSSIRHV